MKLKIAIITLCAFVGLSSVTLAAESRTMCVYDPSGAAGDAYAVMKDYQLAATGWDVNFKLVPYTNEKTASDDFKTGKCDAVFLTGLRARNFNKFASTLEAMGALPSYGLLKKTIGLISKDKAAKFMKVGDYESAAVVPMGAVYLLVRDKKNSSIESLAGKKVATIDFDQAAKYMVQKAGASMVPADLSTFAGIFNNGAADVTYSPATAFKPLELEKGLASGGGVVRYPIAQLTGQILLNATKFPADFGQKSRTWAFDHFDKFLKLSTKADKDIKSKYWIDITPEQKAQYDQLLQDVRVHLRDKEKVYDKNMLTIMRRVRCAADKTRPECASKVE